MSATWGKIITTRCRKLLRFAIYASTSKTALTNFTEASSVHDTTGMSKHRLKMPTTRMRYFESSTTCGKWSRTQGCLMLNTIGLCSFAYDTCDSCTQYRYAHVNIVSDCARSCGVHFRILYLPAYRQLADRPTHRLAMCSLVKKTQLNKQHH